MVQNRHSEIDSGLQKSASELRIHEPFKKGPANLEKFVFWVLKRIRSMFYTIYNIILPQRAIKKNFIQPQSFIT